MQLIIFVEKNSVIEKGFINVNLKHWKSKFEMTRGCQDSLIRQDLLRVLPFQTLQKSPTSKLACLNITQNTFFIFQFLKIQQNTLWFLKTKTCTWEMAEGLVDLMAWTSLADFFCQHCHWSNGTWTDETFLTARLYFYVHHEQLNTRLKISGVWLLGKFWPQCKYFFGRV